MLKQQHSFLESSHYYWVFCNHSHPTGSQTLYLHPNTNTLISGPQVLLWTLLSVQTIRDRELQSWAVD